MLPLNYYRLGTSPSQEALRLKSLYLNVGMDKAIEDEFPVTVDRYRAFTLAEIEHRIEKRYRKAGDAIGVIAVGHQYLDVGMAVTGPKDIINPNGDNQELIHGVNVSAWILSQYRQKGFGQQLIAHSTDLAYECVNNPDLPNWYDKQVWTSIKPENTASRLACEDTGFVEVGIQVEHEDRLLYLLER